MSTDIVAVIDSVDMCNNVMKLVCNGKIGKDCKKPISDLTKAPVLTITLKEHKFEFKHEDYVFFNEKEELKCRFGDLADLRAK